MKYGYIDVLKPTTKETLAIIYEQDVILVYSLRRIMIYWMIYINPIPLNVKKFILDMAEMYNNKYGKLPDICSFSHELPEIEKKIGNISMIHDKYVPKFQFWFSESKEDGIS